MCTATLAWGVNLPAHMVVIKVSFFSTSCYQDTVSNCGLCMLPDDGSSWMHCVLIASLIQFPYWVQWTLIIASVLFSLAMFQCNIVNCKTKRENVVAMYLQGTQLYDPKAGGWRELGMLDVMQVIWTSHFCLQNVIV